MKFSYTAVNSDGKREQGSLVAKSSVAAGHQLKERGLTPVNLKEEGGFSFLGLLDNILTVSLTEKLVFVENLELMMKSGVPVSRTLSILAKQTHNRQFSKVITGLYDTVENGGSLHEAMANYPKVFSDLFVSMVRVGEMSGSMELSLKQLGIQLEREADLRSRVKGAMIYPTVIVVAMIVMGVGMATFVLPKLTSVFKDFETTLPFATQMVVNATDFFAAHAILVMIALVGGLGGIFLGVKSKPGSELLGRLSLYLPGIGPLAVKINVARFTRVLSSLLTSGIPIVEALTVAAESIPNVDYKKTLLSTAERVKVGKNLTEELANYERLYPFIVVQMLEVGEETGSLEEILLQIATHYETQVDATLKNLSSIIEPLLLLIIGAAVGALAYALIIPIYNIGSNI